MSADDWTRGDALKVAINAGRRLGIAEARGIVNGRGAEAIADTLRVADELASYDPALGKAIREAALDVLHGRPDGTIDGDVVVEARELPPGAPA